MGARTRILFDAIKLAKQGFGKYAKSTIDVDYKVLTKVGWKPGAARGISHGIFAGSAANYFKSDNTQLDDGISSSFNGSSSNKSNQARGGFQSNSGRSRSGKYGYNKRYRHTCSCKPRRRRNR